MAVNAIFKVFVKLIALLCASSIAHAQSADTYPSRAIKLLVGYATGGPNDLIARSVATKLGDIWTQAVVVDNRPGASGIVAGQAVARSDPDGYTLILDGVTHSIVPALFDNLPFDPLNDFTSVGQVAYAPTILLLNQNVAARTVPELIALAKARPGSLNYSSSGKGTSTHIGMELFKQEANIDVVHIAYKGSAPAMTDLIGGQIQIAMTSLPGALPSVRSGKIRALAVAGAKREKDLPGVPTIAESGFPGFDVGTWWGVFGPPRLPRNIVEKLNGGINRTLQDTEVQQRMTAIGGEARGSTPERFDELVRKDAARFGVIIRKLGIRPD